MNAQLTETMIMYPNRVFHCDKENRMMGRKGVWKDKQGRYHCGLCGEVVKDVTNTQTGEWCMKFVGSF
jgi:hypothetical protein